MIIVCKERRFRKEVALHATLQDEFLPLSVPPDKLHFARIDLIHILDSITLVKQVTTFAQRTI